MTTSFLVFQLYGPMASWGEIAVGEERDTASHPTRTAVLGICAAALGIPRTEEEQLQALNSSMGFAVCVDAPGDILRDYHTVQSPSGIRARDLPTRRAEIKYGNLNATLSKRHYRTDAYYTVCIWRHDDDGLVELTELAAALRKPEFTLFLGRKSCPTALPTNPKVTEAATIKDAIQSYPVASQMRPLFQNSHSEISVFWDANSDGAATGLEPIHQNERWDRLISRERWQFARRQEAFGRMARKSSPKEQ